MFAQLTHAMNDLDDTLGAFMKADARTRRAIVATAIRRGRLSPTDLDHMYEFNLVCANDELAAVAVEAQSAPIFAVTVGRMKQGWGLLPNVFSAAHACDASRVRMHEQTTEVLRQLREHGVRRDAIAVGNPVGVARLRRMGWRTKHVPVLPAYDLTLTGAEAPPDAAAVHALRATMAAAAVARVAAIQHHAPPACGMRMARAWTYSIGLRRVGRAQHGRYYHGVETMAQTGGSESAAVAAEMIAIYHREYPGSYSAATATSYMLGTEAHENAMTVAWGLVPLTMAVGSVTLRDWGGVLQIAYCALMHRRIDWLIFALCLLPPGPSDVRYREGASGVTAGIRVGTAMVELATRESSPFVASALSLVVCAGYGHGSAAEYVTTSVLFRNNARYLIGAGTVGQVLARLADLDRLASNVCFMLLRRGVVVGGTPLSPVLTSIWVRERGPLGPVELHLAAFVSRSLLPVLTLAERATSIAAGACLYRKDIPPELVRIILLLVPKPSRPLRAVWHEEMPRTLLHGVVF